MTVNNGGERGGQIGKWIDGVELAGLYERRDGRPVLGTGVVSSEKSILAIESNRPDGSFNGVVVDLYSTVSQEGAESVPIFGDIGECFAQRRLASDTGAVMDKPGVHVGDQRRRPFLPPGKASLWIEATQFGLDPIQFTDPFDAFLGNG
ncbi:hypothetical protein FHW37_10951 [Neorhizobium alkalisoli]|uniref:Uncharacterized protein n=1 Tax=Neorhizobium alkalisoli TaxID=528178 RepID=A0A561QC90_9HYPH|nr:hypothetical protein FHW37_10951 [Neorhizobium alkalisoli]